MLQVVDQAKRDASEMIGQEVLIDPMSIDIKHAVILYPKKLEGNDILLDNLEHVVSDLKDLINENNLSEEAAILMKRTEFDIEKDRYSNLAEQHHQNCIKIYNRMNEKISPYRWNISKDTNDKICGYHVVADYLLVLVKDCGEGMWVLK